MERGRDRGSARTSRKVAAQGKGPSVLRSGASAGSGPGHARTRYGLHSERVCSFALRIATELKLADSELRALELGALLHDIGKIGVPDAILLKPGGLSDDEWRQMREHPELGARILSATPFLEEAVVVVRSHHERFDGSGYPCGLAGDQIPLLARVFAVADVFDAITSKRPYHEAFRRRRCSGDRRKCWQPFRPAGRGGVPECPETEWRELRERVSAESGE
ncbi:MAG: HD-GYP domain-containing protein [Planctomycetes bacterium]|nr:HD-GYP domain-containing protein [Planctomycetota bacterium]